MKKITYRVGSAHGEIYWAASEYFGELSGKSFPLGEMEAEKLEHRTDLGNTSKLLLSAISGAVIQRLIDENVNSKLIFSKGTITIPHKDYP